MDDHDEEIDWQGKFSPETLTWIQDMLEKYKDRTVIFLTHHNVLYGAGEENADTQKDEGGAGNAEPKKEQGERNAPHGLQRVEQLLALERGPIETGAARQRVSSGLLPARSTAHQRGVGGGHGSYVLQSRGAAGNGRTGVGLRAAA
jgi:hypothetical protein